MPSTNPPIVWAEIPVRDMDAARRFYETVFEWTLVPEDGGPNPMLAFPSGGGLSGHLYPGTPATNSAGPTLHLAVRGKLEDAADRVRKAGGTMLDAAPETIPPGRFAYALDPDGNSIGLFEPAG